MYFLLKMFHVFVCSSSDFVFSLPIFVFLRCGMLLLALAFLLWFNCCRSVLFVLLSYLIDLVVLLCNFEFVFSCFCLVALLAS